jgi:hypothetical protein
MAMPLLNINDLLHSLQTHVLTVSDSFRQYAKHLQCH